MNNWPEVLELRVIRPERKTSRVLPARTHRTRWLIDALDSFHWLLWRDGSLPEDYYDTRRKWVRWFVRLPLVMPIVVEERVNGILHPEFDREILESHGGSGDA